MTLIQRILTDLIRVDPFHPYHPCSIAEVINVTTSNNSAGSQHLTRRDLLCGAVAAASLSAVSDAAFVLASSETSARSITGVAGIKIGHFTDSRRPTGCTAILTEEGAVAGVDVR